MPKRLVYMPSTADTQQSYWLFIGRVKGVMLDTFAHICMANGMEIMETDFRKCKRGFILAVNSRAYVRVSFEKKDPCLCVATITEIL